MCQLHNVPISQYTNVPIKGIQLKKMDLRVLPLI
jgi:hypothetical protein